MQWLMSGEWDCFLNNSLRPWGSQRADKKYNRYKEPLLLLMPCLAVAVQSCTKWVPILKNLFLLGNLQGKRVTIRQIMNKDTLKGTWAFNYTFCIQWGLIHTQEPYEVGVITNLGYLRYYNNLEKLTPSVLISIDLPILIFSAFRAFIYCVNELFWSSGSGDWKITS